MGSAFQPCDRIDTEGMERTRQLTPPRDEPHIRAIVLWRSVMQDVSTHRKTRRQVRPALSQRRIVATGVLSAISALVLAGCGGGEASTGDAAVGGVAPVPNSAAHFDSAPSGKSAPGTPAGPAEVSRTGTPVIAIGPKLTRSASLEIRVTNIGTAATRVRSIASGLQGLVLSEQIGNGGPVDPGPLKDGSEPFVGSGTP
jgi:hypothetical protein